MQHILHQRRTQTVKPGAEQCVDVPPNRHLRALMLHEHILLKKIMNQQVYSFF